MKKLGSLFTLESSIWSLKAELSSLTVRPDYKHIPFYDTLVSSLRCPSAQRELMAAGLCRQYCYHVTFGAQVHHFTQSF